MSKDYRNVKMTSFLGAGTELEGTLEVKGGMRLDGKLSGRVDSKSVVYVGDTAQIQADIQAEAVVSSGQIEGDITGTRQVQVSLPGRLKGTVETRELILEKGVFFEGSCKMTDGEKK